MTDVPQYLTLKRHRDLAGRERKPWSRRALLCLVLAVPVAGLVGVFGQAAVTSVATTPAARLRVQAADRLRGGLLGQEKFEIDARTALRHATLVLDTGWTDGFQINTIEPNPLAEADRGDRLALDFGHVPAGTKLVVRIQFQVNPTTIGSRPQGVELDDGERPIVRVDRTLTVFP